MKVLTLTNSPFKSEHAAKIRVGQMHLEEGTFTIVPHEDGYAIEVEGEETMNSPEGAVTETVEAKPKKKHNVTAPWKPASYLHIPSRFKQPGYRYRFCKKDKPGNIDKKIAEGWEVDTELTKKMRQHTPTIEDGKPLDSTLQVRELIVMRLPEEIGKARDEYYAKRASGASESAQARFKQDAAANDSQIYGEVTEN